jgi:hypothetical protein
MPGTYVVYHATPSRAGLNSKQNGPAELVGVFAKVRHQTNASKVLRAVLALLAASSFDLKLTAVIQCSTLAAQRFPRHTLNPMNHNEPGQSTRHP